MKSICLLDLRQAKYYHIKTLQSLCSMLGYSGISNWSVVFSKSFFGEYVNGVGVLAELYFGGKDRKVTKYE